MKMSTNKIIRKAGLTILSFIIGLIVLLWVIEAVPQENKIDNLIKATWEIVNENTEYIETLEKQTSLSDEVFWTLSLWMREHLKALCDDLWTFSKDPCPDTAHNVRVSLGNVIITHKLIEQHLVTKK